MSSGREFQIGEAATGKARLPTVVDVTGGIRMRFVPAERSARQPGTMITLYNTDVQLSVISIHVYNKTYTGYDAKQLSRNSNGLRADPCGMPNVACRMPDYQHTRITNCAHAKQTLSSKVLYQICRTIHSFIH